MNRGQLRAKLVLRLRIPPAGDPLLDEPTLNDMIRLALTDLCEVSDWPWLVTSASLTFTAGVAPMPATFVKAQHLVINSLRAKYVGLAEFLDNQGAPTWPCWTDQGSNIVLTPVPATSPPATLYFLRNEPDLTTDISSPLVPEAHQNGLIARAAYHAEVRRGRAEAASFHNAEWETTLKRMADATHRVSGPRQIRESMGNSRWATW